MSFWRTEEPTFTDDGKLIKGGMFKHQREAWNSKAFITMLVGGYGSGKSGYGAKRDLAIALHNAPVPHLVISPSYKIAKRTVIVDIMANLRGRGIKFTYNKSDFEFIIYYKGKVATIWIGSGDNADSLKGPNIGSLRIDEPFIQDVEVFEQGLFRTRHPDAKQHEILLCGTPEDLNWGYDIAEGDKSEDFDIKVIHAKTSDNKALPKERVDQMWRTFGGDERQRDAYFNGKFVNLSSGQVYYAFDRTVNVKTMERIKGATLVCGMDFGVNPMAFCVYQCVPNGLHMLKEYELPQSDTSKAAELLRSEWGAQLKHIIPDATGRRTQSSSGGKSDHAILRGSPYNFEVDAGTINPFKRDRFNAVNALLKSGNLTFDPSCKNVVRYMEQLTHEKMDTKQKQMTHITDAAGYPVARMFPIIHAQVRETRFYK